MSDLQLPQHIDSTMITCFRGCPQKFYREFVQGLRPPGLSIDLHAGACFASALENTYRYVWVENLPLDEALHFAMGKFFLQWGDFEIPEYKKTTKTRERVWDAVEEYFLRFPPKTDHTQPYFNPDGSPTFEWTFAIPLDFPGFPTHPSGEPFLYSGRLDMLGMYEGRPCGRDEKTTARGFSQNWAETWDLRSQFIGYTWALRQCGIDADTIVVRGVGIQVREIKLLEAVKQYSDFIRDRWFNQLRSDLNRLVKCWNEQYFDFNLGDQCTQYGICQFHDACMSPNPEPWLSHFEVRHWNPLLKDPTT